MPVGVSAYLVPVDALQRGLDLRLRERGVDGVGQRGHSRDAVRLSAGARERRVFERADRGSGTPARRGRVEGVAGNAAERVKTHHLDGRGAPRPRSFSGAGGLCEPSTSGVRFSTRFLSSSVNDFESLTIRPRRRAKEGWMCLELVNHSVARESPGGHPIRPARCPSPRPRVSRRRAGRPPPRARRGASPASPRARFLRREAAPPGRSRVGSLPPPRPLRRRVARRAAGSARSATRGTSAPSPRKTSGRATRTPR